MTEPTLEFRVRLATRLLTAERDRYRRLNRPTHAQLLEEAADQATQLLRRVQAEGPDGARLAFIGALVAARFRAKQTMAEGGTRMTDVDDAWVYLAIWAAWHTARYWGVPFEEQTP